MININILFPREKKRILKEISQEIKNKYNKDVKNFKFTHIGDEKVYLYVFLEDETPLYITASIIDVSNSMTICEDMSY